MQEWCRANHAEMLAVQAPGRNSRSSETPITTAAALAAQLLPIVASRLVSVPYIVRRILGQIPWRVVTVIFNLPQSRATLYCFC